MTAAHVQENNNDKEVIFKICAPFTDSISKIKNTQIDNAKHIVVVIPIYNSIEYRYLIEFVIWKFMTML